MVNYLIAYATKNEKYVCDAMKDVKDSIMANENSSAREKLKALGTTFIDARSVSIQESVYRITDLPMSFSKPQVIFVPSDMPHERHGMLKPRHRMSELDEQSDDIYEIGYIDRYPERPDALRDLCFFEFAANYQTFNSKITETNKDRIINLKDPRLGKIMKRTCITSNFSESYSI